jgi:hypothetical protein
MKNKIVLLAFIISSILLFAQAPQTINYQGYLEDGSGAVNSSTLELGFSIYDANSGGNLEWGAENITPTIVDGVFNVTLGQSTPINLTWDEEYWLQIVVDPNGSPTSLPRVRIASGGYSLTTQRIENTDAAGQSAISAINSATSGTINTARLNSGVVLEAENPNASGDISGNYSSGLTIDNNSVGADELNVSGNGTSGQILSSDGDGSFSWVADQTGGGGGSATYEIDVSSSKMDLTLTYVTMPGVSLNLDANSVYSLLGSFQDAEDGGTDGRFDIKLNYTGTYTYYFFDNFGGADILYPTALEDLRNTTDDSGTFPSYVIGTIITNSSGIATFQFRLHPDGTNDVDINSGAKFTLIKL